MPTNRCAFGIGLKSQLFLLFSLFLLLFINPIVLFGIIHRFYCTISLNKLLLNRWIRPFFLRKLVVEKIQNQHTLNVTELALDWVVQNWDISPSIKVSSIVWLEKGEQVCRKQPFLDDPEYWRGIISTPKQPFFDSLLSWLKRPTTIYRS